MDTSSTPNPFPFTSPASGRDFYGRRDALQRIFGAVLEGQSVAITAPRYMGKSSLLAHVQTPDVQRLYGLSPNRWIFARVPCSKVSTATQLADHAIEAIRRVLGLRTLSLLSPTAQQVLERREPDEIVSAERGSGLSDLSQVGRSLRARDGGLVLLLDDFENLLALPDRAILTDLLGLAASGVPLVMTLDHQPMDIAQRPEEVLSSQTARSLYRPYHQGGFKTLMAALGDHVTLGPLSEDEAREILEEGFEDAAARLSPEDAQIILSLGGGHPALLQTAAFIGFHQLASGQGHIAAEETTKATAEAARTYLQALWRDLSPLGQARALELTRGIDPHLPCPEDDELRDKNLLAPSLPGAPTRLFSPLFETFVKSRAPVPTLEATGQPRLRGPRQALSSKKAGESAPQEDAAPLAQAIRDGEAPPNRTTSSISWALPFPMPSKAPASPTGSLSPQGLEPLEPGFSAPHLPPPQPKGAIPWTSQDLSGPSRADEEAPPAPSAPRGGLRARRPWILGSLLALGILGIAYLTADTLMVHLSDSGTSRPRVTPLVPERGPRGTTVTLLLLISAPLLGLGTGFALRRTLPRHNRQGFPRHEEDAQRLLQSALKSGDGTGQWALKLLEMSQATTLDDVADARWIIDGIEVAEDGKPTLFDVPELALQALRSLAAVTMECSTATRASTSQARGVHLAKALGPLEAVEDPLGQMDPGTLRDGMWLVSRVWRRIIVDAFEGSAGRARLSATLLTQQVRYAERVEVVLEVANQGSASAIGVEVALMPPVGAALIPKSHHKVGTIEPGLLARARFALKPYRREPIYLTFQISHRESLRGDQVLQLNERLAFVTLGKGFTRVQPIPYVTGKPLEPGQIFVGRRQDLLFVREALLESATPPTILVIGRRRMGKTSLLRHIPFFLGDAAVTAQVDYQARPADDLPHLMAWMAGRLRAQHPEGPLPPLSPEEFEEDPGTALMELAIDPLLRAAGKRPVVLLIDEVEALYEPMASGALSPRFFENMRSLLQKRPQVALVLAGTLKLAERSAQVTSVLFGAALTRELTFLTRDDVGLLMREPLAPFNIEIAPLAVDRLHQLSGGHPLVSQHLCYHLVRRLNRLEVNFVTAEDVDAVTGEAIEGAQDHLLLWWTQADARGRWVLSALAKGESKPMTAADVQRSLQRLNIRPPLVEVRASLRALARLGLLKEHGAVGAHQYRQELFRQWVEQYQSSQESRARFEPWEDRGQLRS